GAEGDDVLRAGAARERAGGVVVRVAVRRRARRLEQPRVPRRPAAVRPAVRPRAAVLRRPERLARAPARHRRRRRRPGLLVVLLPRHLQLRGAQRVHVADAPGVPARRAVHPGARRRHADADVVPVHQAHVVEVLPVGAAQRELGEGDRRRAAEGAAHGAAAVPRDAGEGRGAGGCTVRARPQAAGPTSRGRERDVGAGRQLEPAAPDGHRGVAGQGGRPDGVGAVVAQREDRRADCLSAELQ
ncbi:Os03g0233251, partial [Oryza sativa Japonica Group]